jgi:hypothetical protein
MMGYKVLDAIKAGNDRMPAIIGAMPDASIDDIKAALRLLKRACAIREVAEEIKYQVV